MHELVGECVNLTAENCLVQGERNLLERTVTRSESLQRGGMQEWCSILRLKP